MHAREVDTLEAALDSGDHQQLISAVTELQAASASAAASAAVATAAQRSGRRGVAARKVIVRIVGCGKKTIATLIISICQTQ
jgi:uncharacterized protein (DUF2147 family)